MSEPVGNGPREPRGVIPSNSHKEREAQKPPADDRTPLTPIVVGQVTTRKKPWYRRAASNMVADDAQTVGEYLVLNVLVPNLKNLIRDIVVGGIDRTLYGGGMSTPSRVMGAGRGSAENMRNKYHQMSTSTSYDPRPSISREARAVHNFDELIIPSRESAINVISDLVDRIDKFGVATVADLYDLCGVTGDWAARGYGWRDLNGADVKQYRNGWLLSLPKPIELRG